MKSDRRNFIKLAGLAGIGIAGTGLNLSCAAKKPEKTLADMKVAYIREETTEDKYNKFGQKAKEENFIKVALMFTAIAKAEGIHGANHKRVLDKLKGNYPASPVGNYEVRSTLENLEDGLKGETYEYDTMYPAFIKEANDENVPDAVNSFTWARQVEKQHQGYYNVAITAMGTRNEITLPEAWYVCPKCGGTYAQADVKNTCYFDPTPKDQFIEFK